MSHPLKVDAYHTARLEGSICVYCGRNSSAVHEAMCRETKQCMILSGMIDCCDSISHTRKLPQVSHPLFHSQDNNLHHSNLDTLVTILPAPRASSLTKLKTTEKETHRMASLTASSHIAPLLPFSSQLDQSLHCSTSSASRTLHLEQTRPAPSSRHTLHPPLVAKLAERASCAKLPLDIRDIYKRMVREAEAAEYYRELHESKDGTGIKSEGWDVRRQHEPEGRISNGLRRGKVRWADQQTIELPTENPQMDPQLEVGELNGRRVGRKREDIRQRHARSNGGPVQKQELAGRWKPIGVSAFDIFMAETLIDSYLSLFDDK